MQYRPSASLGGSDFYPSRLELQYREDGSICLVDEGGYVVTRQQFLETILPKCMQFFLAEDDKKIENFNYTLHLPKTHSSNGIPLKPPQAGYVYLIRKGTSDYYKIGFSQDPDKRLRQLSVGPVRDLKIIYSILCRNAEVAEEMMHHTFAEKRHIGEWFILNAEDVKLFIKTVNYRQVKDNIL